MSIIVLPTTAIDGELVVIKTPVVSSQLATPALT
jgi:hypothetical protein